MAKTKPTLDDVASLAGVSSATVSRFINGKGQIAPATAARIQTAIEELNYRPHLLARALATDRMGAVGFITNYLTSPFYTPVLRGVESVTRRNGFELLIFSTQGEPGRKTGYHRPLGDNNTDGLIVFADALDADELVYLDGLQFPMVMLYQSPPAGTSIPYITSESKKSAYAMTAHLVQEHGYRRIAYLQGGEKQEDSWWREQGYRQALQDFGIPFDAELVCSGGYTISSTKQAVEHWLRLPNRPQAIFAFDDEKAYTVMHFLQAAGLSVPKDMAVVGFDDLRVFDFPLPTLTTVRAPIEETAAMAASILIDSIQNKNVEPQVLMPTELVVRGSCGCPYQPDQPV